jgi:hypothetical protein
LSYKENIDNISKYMSTEQSRTDLYGRDWEVVDKSIKTMINTINQALQEAEIKIPREEVKTVFNGINRIIDVIIHKAFSTQFKEFTGEFILLVFNWNTIANVEEASRKINIVRHFISYHNSTVAAIDLLKELLRKFNDIRSFEPPSFKLSEHYLKSLNNKFNKFRNNTQ